MPQEKLKELRDRGEEITRIIEVPLVAYLGDTAPGPWLVREDVRKAQIAICECTFTEAEHADRAKIGMHMHAEAIAEWLRVLECQGLVLTHLSRRTNLGFARKRIGDLVGPQLMKKVEFLMDYKYNKERYEKQLADNGQLPDELASRARPGGGGGRPMGRPGGGGGAPMRGGPPRGGSGGAGGYGGPSRGPMRPR